MISLGVYASWNENIVNASANIWLVYYATIYFMNRSASKPLILLFTLVAWATFISKNKFILYFCGFCKEPQYLCNSYNALAWPAMKWLLLKNIYLNIYSTYCENKWNN